MNSKNIIQDTPLSFSLIWPTASHYHEWINKDYPLKDDLIKDIRLDKICSEIQVNYNYNFLLSQLSCVIDNEETIKYRRDFLKDIITYPWFPQVFSKIRNIISVIENESSVRFNKGSSLYISLWYIQKITHVYDFCEMIYNSINPTGDPRKEIKGYSDATLKLYKMADILLHDPAYKNIKTEVDDILNNLSQYQNLKVIVNLKRNKCYFTLADPREEVLYTKITGEEDKKNIYLKHGIFSFPLFDEIINILRSKNPEFFYKILAAGKKIEAMEHIYETFLNFNQELDFYESALVLKELYEKLQLPYCMPELPGDSDESVTSLGGFYDLVIALHMADEGKFNNGAIVTNDVDLSRNERIAIITGPNQGGKTTWLRAVTLCQVLFQAGLFVPAKKAVLSVKDFIFTHFPANEKFILSKGRMGEEASRMKIIFKNITRNSMVMMNESFSSTNAIDGLNIISVVIKVCVQ